ncbi:CST complex subunit CTC1-like [Archocentrus centrarchus]|uniref:CST complex subunit CTC1-like n=1 Tax=Archocentrus centrarchus TaxID=63155 RepID=UPI0011E9BC4A|nr:CST complex subunit CTC1-like [Archocentrus centrarchus]
MNKYYIFFTATLLRRSSSYRRWCWCSQVSALDGFLSSSLDLSTDSSPLTPRTGSVYFTYLPVSSITVVSLGDTSSACPPPAPIMHLGQWALSSEQRCTVGQVKGHVVCCLFLQLQWSCSLCGSVYRQACSSSQCRSLPSFAGIGSQTDHV